LLIWNFVEELLSKINILYQLTMDLRFGMILHLKEVEFYKGISFFRMAVR